MAKREQIFFGGPEGFSLVILGLVFVSVSLFAALAGDGIFPADAADGQACSGECKIYASPSGNDNNSGTTPASPKTFLGAAAAARPGSVVCLGAGTYELSSTFVPPESGTSSAWIVYRSCEDGAVNFVWTGPADASPMFKFGTGKFPSGPAYLEFRGLNLDGRGNALDGFFCFGSHHLRFVGNTVANTGGAGIASVTCDYLTADHNLIYHNGYIPPGTKVPQWYSWTSGISFNSSQWFDSYAGFHNIISNDIITAEVDQSPNHTDGNGIILDLSNRTYEFSSANTPPALVVNNVAYGNGGRCIEAYTVSNFWFVNNTCYNNGLDPSVGRIGSITSSNSRDGFVVNNIVAGSREGNWSYDQQNRNSNIRYYANLSFGGSNDFNYADPSQFIQADPRFSKPNGPDAIGKWQYPALSASDSFASSFALRADSPARGKGIDPGMLPGLSKDILVDFEKVLYEDIRGAKRPRRAAFDLGAFQSTNRLP